jgi:hypothetical protein
MRSTSRSRLSLCRCVSAWRGDRLSLAWLSWCESRLFRVTEPLRG